MASPVAAQTGLLVVAHGGSEKWNAGVKQVTAQVRWDGPIATAFLMGEEAEASGWSASVARLVGAGAKEIVVVPLLVSSHGGHYRQIRFYAGELTEWVDASDHRAHTAVDKPPVPMRVTQALDDAPELGAALLERWRALPPNDQQRPLVLVAHGPTSDEEAALWVRNLQSATRELGQTGKTRVGIGLLRDDAPAPVRAAAIAELRGTIQRLANEAKDSVAVLPVLISSGAIDTRTIPRDLAGLPVRYTPVALSPLSVLARWIERVASAK